MLSYKHGFHAGNHADVLKHIVLIYLHSLVKKHNKSISYVDTHSGNGMYMYISRYMEKNKEYKNGIKRIEKYLGDNKLIKNYLNIIKKISKNNQFYPGSPFIVSNISNNTDKLYFCELHNNEFDNLKKNLNQFTNVKKINVDGFEYLEKKLKDNKSYFILIDPSYEIKDDFIKINKILDNMDKYQKTKILIWYPILNYEDNDKFIENLRKKGISRMINLELPVISQSLEKGMKGSGLLIINFKENKILRDLKALSKELHLYLKQNDDVYNPKVRYL